jgi:hypothetical protein
MPSGRGRHNSYNVAVERLIYLQWSSGCPFVVAAGNKGSK